MNHFSMRDLSRRVADILQAADRSPVQLTKHGKGRYVLMSNDHYERLLDRPGDPRRILDLKNLSPDDAAEIDEALRQAPSDE